MEKVNCVAVEFCDETFYLKTSFLNLKIVFGKPTFVDNGEATFCWIVSDGQNIYQISDKKEQMSWYPEQYELAEFDVWNWRVKAESREAFQKLEKYFLESLNILKSK